jgi:hypothetical protein
MREIEKRIATGMLDTWKSLGSLIHLNHLSGFLLFSK